MLRRKKRFPIVGLLSGFLALPSSFLAGLVTGLAAPLAAIAGLAGGLFLLTGKVPSFVPAGEDEEGYQQFTFRLVPPERARELLEEQKGRIGGEIDKLKVEFQGAVEEGKAQA